MRLLPNPGVGAPVMAPGAPGLALLSICRKGPCLDAASASSEQAGVPTPERGPGSRCHCLLGSAEACYSLNPPVTHPSAMPRFTLVRTSQLH